MYLTLCAIKVFISAACVMYDYSLIDDLKIVTYFIIVYYCSSLKQTKEFYGIEINCLYIINQKQFSY